MTNIQIDTEAIQTIAQKAILEGLGQDQRDLIIQQAVEGLLARPKNQNSWRGDHDPSPLQIAFNNAVSSVAMQIAREVVAEDERVKERIRELMGEVIAELLGDEGYSEAAEIFAGALTSAIRERLGQVRQL